MTNFMENDSFDAPFFTLPIGIVMITKYPILYAIAVAFLMSCGAATIDGGLEGDDKSSTTKASSGKLSSSASNAECEDLSDATHFTDCRNGTTYKLVEVGGQTWFAENLNFETSTGSHCFDQDVENCNSYGRLYTHAAASEACPEGWNLPDTSDWSGLVSYVGGAEIAGQVLKAKSAMWEDNSGTDDLNFAALPGGGYIAKEYTDLGTYAYFWSSVKKSTYAYYLELEDTYDGASMDWDSQTYAFSVRCMKGELTPRSSQKTSSSSRNMSSEEEASSGAQSSSVKTSSGQSNSSSAKLSSSLKASSSTLRSSSAPLSSSVLRSSSAINPSFSYGSVTDSRDTKVYRTLQIGTQKWIVDNMRYDAGATHSVCLNGGTDCSTYGRYYDYSAAKSACPTGYRLPTNAEWATLGVTAGASTFDGTPLLAISNLWNATGATNSSGFSVLPGGYYDIMWAEGSDAGNYADYWTANDADPYAGLVYMSTEDFSFGSVLIEDYMFPVRCIEGTPFSSSSTVSSSSSSSSSSSNFFEYGTPMAIGNNSYTTVVIGTQTWMAENMNEITTGSACYDEDENYCDEYGRLYTLEAAKTVCPTGWSLPAEADWDLLFNYAGGASVAGLTLKATEDLTTLNDWWDDNMENQYGFSVFPGGYLDDGNPWHEGYAARFWTSTVSASDEYMLIHFFDEESIVEKLKTTTPEYYQFSVRCVKD